MAVAHHAVGGHVPESR